MSAVVEPSEAPSRRLRPALAFFAGLLGFGYLYVGRIGLAIAFLIATLAVFLIGGWTRALVHPTAWYAVILCGLLIAAIALLHPILIAWRRPVAARKRYNRWWFYLGWVVVIGSLCDVLIIGNRGRALGYEIFRIPSEAMAPTLEPGDLIVVDTWRYRSVPPQFGDIVVYLVEEDVNYVKRLVGLPGDTLEMRGRALVRNGDPVAERYIHEPLPGLPGRGIAPVTLGPDEYFVLGDNRDNSQDSRYTGPIRSADIVGRGEFIALSFWGGVRWERFRTLLPLD
jgi:signal peptidase I